MLTTFWKCFDNFLKPRGLATLLPAFVLKPWGREEGLIVPMCWLYLLVLSSNKLICASFLLSSASNRDLMSNFLGSPNKFGFNIFEVWPAPSGANCRSGLDYGTPRVKSNQKMPLWSYQYVYIYGVGGSWLLHRDSQRESRRDWTWSECLITGHSAESDPDQETFPRRPLA